MEQAILEREPVDKSPVSLQSTLIAFFLRMNNSLFVFG